MDKVPMTAEGYAALEAEIKHLAESGVAVIRNDAWQQSLARSLSGDDYYSPLGDENMVDYKTALAWIKKTVRKYQPPF